MTNSAGSWIVRPRPNPAAHLRLFCFPHAGAGASTFRLWPDVMPASVELCAIQLPGREARLGEASYTDASQLVQALAAALAPYCDRPFAFFGHSMGALVSFELARYLRTSHGLLPVHLFVAGHSAPQLPTRFPVLHDLPDAELIAALRQLEGTPEDVLQHAELMELLLPTLRADLTLCETHVHMPSTPLACPITALLGEHDHTVSYAELAAWQEHTLVGFRLRLIPGSHFFLQESRHELAAAISEDLEDDLGPGVLAQAVRAGECA